MKLWQIAFIIFWPLLVIFLFSGDEKKSVEKFDIEKTEKATQFSLKRKSDGELFTCVVTHDVNLDSTEHKIMQVNGGSLSCEEEAEIKKIVDQKL